MSGCGRQGYPIAVRIWIFGTIDYGILKVPGAIYFPLTQEKH
jgi:hypothetical protein